MIIKGNPMSAIPKIITLDEILQASKKILEKRNDKNAEIILSLVTFYLKDNKPFYIGYSAGKDSTVTVDLVFKALLLIKEVAGVNAFHKTVAIMLSDTKMEADPLVSLIDDSFKRIDTFVKKHSLPVEAHRVEPIVEETFMVLVVGKGYALPDTQNRFCTDRMKIRPQQRFINNLNEKYDGVYAITGVRHAEGVDRSNRLKRGTIDGMLKKHDFPNWNMLTPIENFSQAEVWSYIYTDSLEWVNSNKLGRLYGEAGETSNECRTLFEGAEGESAGCSNSRYGCWICPLFKEDRMLKSLGNHYEYMKKMEEFRNWLVGFKDMGWSSNRRVYKNSRQAKGIYNKDNHRKGMITPSGTTLEWRKMVLEKLWALNLEVADLRHEPLVSIEELKEIQRLWLIEGDLELSVERITGLSLVSKKDEGRTFALYIKSKLLVEPKSDDIQWFASYYKSIPFVTEHTITERFVTQMAYELLEKYSLVKSIKIFFDLMNYDYYNKERVEAHKILRTLPVFKMFHPSENEESYIRKEWSEDKIGFMTFTKRFNDGEIKTPQRTLFGFDGDYGEHFESLEELNEKGDIAECETISLEDKMAFFDNY